MKNIVKRMKTLVLNNNASGQTLSYVKLVEVAPNDISLLNLSVSMFPSIFISAISTSEIWESSKRKLSENIVHAHLVMRYLQRENSIIGDDTRSQGQGILDFTEDFLTVFRGHRLAIGGVNYLDKPLEITDVEYSPGQLSDDIFLMIARVSMKATHLFIQSDLPGNI